MERCLACLPAADVELLTRYYVGDGGSLIGARRDIAEKLGVSPAAVRQRVFFLRRRLQKCMEQDAARTER
jgi:DNA-directed RNA polymerase specialized sigma24 family protein